CELTQCLFPLLLYLILFSSNSGRALRFTLFPYTTLFRSIQSGYPHPSTNATGRYNPVVTIEPTPRRRGGAVCPLNRVSHSTSQRSEEHTSELQSRENLVCRLLLEKKKKSEHKLPHLSH